MKAKNIIILLISISSTGFISAMKKEPLKATTEPKGFLETVWNIGSEIFNDFIFNPVAQTAQSGLTSGGETLLFYGKKEQMPAIRTITTTGILGWLAWSAYKWGYKRGELVSHWKTFWIPDDIRKLFGMESTKYDAEQTSKFNARQRYYPNQGQNPAPMNNIIYQQPPFNPNFGN